jgi:hypothetical protein
MPSDPRVPADPTRDAQARSFLHRLTGRLAPDGHRIPHGQTVTTQASTEKRPVNSRDPVYNAAMADNSVAVKEDVRQVVTRVRDTLRQMQHVSDPAYMGVADRLNNGLQREGRDRVAYALFCRGASGQMDTLLNGWSDASWSLAQTAGLLLDIGLTIKGERRWVNSPNRPPREGAVDLLSPELRASRGNDKRVDSNSPWAQSLPAGATAQAGVSATTVQLLMMLEDMQVPPHQMEAVLKGVIQFWEGPLKRVSGDYHTASEVWAAYNHYLQSRLADAWAQNKAARAIG